MSSLMSLKEFEFPWGLEDIKKKGIKGLIPIAYASGAMLIRGYERGERVYLSMISRGFNGSIELKKRDYDNSVLLIFLTLISIIVLIVDKYLWVNI